MYQIFLYPIIYTLYDVDLVMFVEVYSSDTVYIFYNLSIRFKIQKLHLRDYISVRSL